MNAVLPMLASDRAPTSTPMFRLVAVITVVVTAFSAAVTPSDALSLTVAAIVIVVLGIPHGAVDHLVAAPADSSSDSSGAAGPSWVSWQFRFHAMYLAAMLMYAAVWFVAPGLALVGFLVLSVHHFGQSDLAHLGLESRRQLAVQISRGSFIVGLPLVAHLSTVAPVVERLGGGDPTSWSWLADHTVAWCVLLVAQHLAVGALVAPHVSRRAAKVREVLTVIVLTPLFVLADPLLGFAIYFGLWHSLSHLHVLAAVLGRRSGPGSMAPVELARLAAPRSVVSVAGMGVFAVGFVATGRGELIVPATVVFVSILTLPHMVVVERLWRDRWPASSQ